MHLSISGALTVNLSDAGRLISTARRKREILTGKLKVIKIKRSRCRLEDKEKFIYEDTLKYSLQIIGLTETHIP